MDWFVNNFVGNNTPSISKTNHTYNNNQLNSIAIGINRLIQPQSLYEMGIHSRTDVSEPIIFKETIRDIEQIVAYTIVVGNSNMYTIQHSHKIYVIDGDKQKNIILMRIGYDYATHLKFVFALEDTLLHSHSNGIIYYCMDDEDGNVSLYSIDVNAPYIPNNLTPPKQCYNTDPHGMYSHAHTLTVVRSSILPS